MATPDRNQGTITTEVAARLLMITPAYVRKLTRDGWLKAAGRDAYPIAGLVHGFINFLQDQHRRAAKAAEANKVCEQRAEEILLRNSERWARMVSEGQAEAIRVIDEIAGPLRADIGAIPAQVTNDLALRRRLENEFDAAFGRASQKAGAGTEKCGRGAAKVARPRRKRGAR